jgi:cell division septation protein DedD
MKKFDLKEKSSVFYIGKGVIILSIIVTSSISFMLGFFVGKSVVSPSAEKASVITPLAGSVQKDIVIESKESMPQQQMPAEQPSEVQAPPEKPEQQKVKDVQESQEIKKTRQSIGSKQDGEFKQSKEKPAMNQESRKPQEVEKTSTKVKYTVQIGAFKNDSEADSLKSKFNKKGYKAFTIVAKTKNHVKLYKVMIGEFSRREEAELLSVKIKRAEGLRTFVALKTDQEAIR